MRRHIEATAADETAACGFTEQRSMGNLQYLVGATASARQVRTMPPLGPFTCCVCTGARR